MSIDLQLLHVTGSFILSCTISRRLRLYYLGLDWHSAMKKLVNRGGICSSLDWLRVQVKLEKEKKE